MSQRESSAQSAVASSSSSSSSDSVLLVPPKPSNDSASTKLYEPFKKTTKPPSNELPSIPPSNDEPSISVSSFSFNPLPDTSDIDKKSNLAAKDLKAVEMMKCFKDIQDALNKQMTKVLADKHSSDKELGYVSCKNQYKYSYDDPYIWFDDYPKKGTCSYNKPHNFASSSFARFSNRNYELSESEKNKRLKWCKNHLSRVKKGERPKPPAPAIPELIPTKKNISEDKEPYDPKAEKMSKCISDIYEINKRKIKEKLIAKGSKPINILCEIEYRPEGSIESYIWDYGQFQPSCWDITNKYSTITGSSLGMSNRAMPISEEEKDKKLEECNQRVNKLLSESKAPAKQKEPVERGGNR